MGRPMQAFCPTCANMLLREPQAQAARVPCPATSIVSLTLLTFSRNCSEAAGRRQQHQQRRDGTLRLHVLLVPGEHAACPRSHPRCESPSYALTPRPYTIAAVRGGEEGGDGAALGEEGGGGGFAGRGSVERRAYDGEVELNGAQSQARSARTLSTQCGPPR